MGAARPIGDCAELRNAGCYPQQQERFVHRARMRPGCRRERTLLDKVKDAYTTSFSHVNPGDTPLRGDGLRDCFLYRDLGVAAATGGKVLAQLVNAHNAPEIGTGWTDTSRTSTSCSCCAAGRKVDTRAIRRTARFTVEGERDDICSIGQTVAAHDLCSNIQPCMKNHHVQLGVGHHGVFSGKRWQRQLCPWVREMIQSHH